MMSSEIKSPKLPFSANESIHIFIDGVLYPREEAKISVFDSLVQGGDGVWEGMRVYNGRIYNYERHIQRLYDSAKALRFEGVPSREYIKNAIFDTLAKNGMRNNAHIRMTLSRGKKVTSGMSPHWNQYGCTLIVIAEWKPPVFESNGVRLICSTIRRNTPACLDSKIHHNNLLNNIMAKIEANIAGVDDAVMLDLNGFVAETNATNIFIVKHKKVMTPFPEACLPGITRATILKICSENGIENGEARLSISELYSADEVFITGTMGEVTPVIEVDGRTFKKGPMTEKLLALYLKRANSEGEELPDFQEKIIDFKN